MPRSGTPIPLKLQFNDGSSSKFVHAVVTDPTQAPLAGSPFVLTHTSNGLFANYSVLMPAVDFVSVQYLVYDDSGYTTLNTSIGIVEETLERSFNLESAIALQASINALMGGVVGKVREDKIFKQVDSGEVTARIGED